MTPRRESDSYTAMTGKAVDIAVSEIFGIPIESMCGYIIIVSQHTAASGEHLDQITTGPHGVDDHTWTAKLLRNMADHVETL